MVNFFILLLCFDDFCRYIPKASEWENKDEPSPPASAATTFLQVHEGPLFLVDFFPMTLIFSIYSRKPRVRKLLKMRIYDDSLVTVFTVSIFRFPGDPGDFEKGD